MKNLALIGNGRWGQNYISESGSLEGCQIKFVRGSDYSDLIDKQDYIDGVIIASPATTHLDVINSFRDSMPMLVEKPVIFDERLIPRIINKRIMAGHTYVYNPSVRILKNSNINYLFFTLLNISNYNSDTSVLWELGPHAVSICYFLFGFPDRFAVKRVGSNIELTLFYKNTTCHLSFGWNCGYKNRFLSVNPNNAYNILDDKMPISPLKNQIKHFLNFIDGEDVDTDIKHIIEVTRLLSYIEEKL